MKQIILAAVAGCATAAVAQNFSLTFVPSVTSVGLGTATFTATVYGDADTGSHLLGGAFSVQASGATQFVQDMTWNPASWSQFDTDNGYAGQGNYNQVVFGQLVIPGIFPPAPGSELGSAIGTFEFTIASGYSNQIIEFELVAGSPFTLETVDSVSGDTFQSSNGNLTLGAFRIGLPTPGTASLLAFGGLMATRRRR
ncbi:MAG: hypothetical protein ACX94C_02730 [Phycisphaerales bacterium]